MTVRKEALAIEAQPSSPEGIRQVQQAHEATSLRVGVILSGGASSRMGSPKALLAFSPSQTFLAHLSEVLFQGGCHVVICVTGCHSAEIAAQLPSKTLLVRNDHWQEGQFSSVRVGLSAALSLRPERVVVHLVDQPAIEPQDVRGVLFGPEVASSDVAIAAYEGTVGHPISMSLQAVRRVVTDDESSTFREALNRACANPLLVASSEGCLKSANTPEELAAVFSHARDEAPTGDPSSK